MKQSDLNIIKKILKQQPKQFLTNLKNYLLTDIDKQVIQSLIKR